MRVVEPLFLCYGCGERLPYGRWPRPSASSWDLAARCWSCRHSHDPDVRGFHGAAPGLERLLAAHEPRLLGEMAQDLDTPDPTNAELASLIRKRLEKPLLEMLVRAEVTGDPKAITAALNALKIFEGDSGGEDTSWLLDSPAGATDSE